VPDDVLAEYAQYPLASDLRVMQGDFTEFQPPAQSTP